MLISLLFSFSTGTDKVVSLMTCSGIVSSGTHDDLGWCLSHTYYMVPVKQLPGEFLAPVLNDVEGHVAGK